MSRVARTVLGLYLLFMLTITLFLFHEARPGANLRPFDSMVRDWQRGGRGFWVNLVGNFVAFVPIGLLLPPSRGPGRTTRAWDAIALGGGFSLAIELAQYTSGRRTGDVDDVLLNTAGALVGFGLYAAIRGRRGPG